MSSPFKVLAPFTPRCVEINYHAFPIPQIPPPPPYTCVSNSQITTSFSALTLGWAAFGTLGLGISPAFSDLFLNASLQIPMRMTVTVVGATLVPDGTVVFDSGWRGPNTYDDRLVSLGQSPSLGFLRAGAAGHVFAGDTPPLISESSIFSPEVGSLVFLFTYSDNPPPDNMVFTIHLYYLSCTDFDPSVLPQDVNDYERIYQGT